MALHIQLNETQIKITSEVNEKLQRIMQHPSFEKIRVDKKNFVNTVLEGTADEELINKYRETIGLPKIT